MIIVTTNDVPGYRIDAVLGEVMGMTVRSANLGANFVASFRSIGGGEVKEYTQLVYESRQEVMHRMVQEAQRRGANAVVGMRFDTGEIAASFSEVCAYGTAVVVSPLAAGQPGATAQSAHQAQGAPSAPQPGGQAFPQDAAPDQPAWR
ncbi:YbjQ family protein [Cellulosimicrobium sp. TH-20]|uniref:heavy metal-binding domain-containing protein n=1 Tax=unclassified Cellulosimicrobium TaxID=2624466 RepID=UPI0015835E75